MTETIGAPANPPLSLQRIALYVPLSNLSTCGLTNFPFQLHRCLLPVDDSSCPHHSAGETPDDLLHHFPCHLRPISAGLVPPRQSDLRRTYLHFICQFFISNLRSVIGLKLTSWGHLPRYYTWDGGRSRPIPCLEKYYRRWVQARFTFYFPLRLLLWLPLLYPSNVVHWFTQNDLRCTHFAWGVCGESPSIPRSFFGHWLASSLSKLIAIYEPTAFHVASQSTDFAFRYV